MTSVKRRPDGQWRARYRDEHGKEHAKHFPRKIDGQNWLDEVTASVVTGTYVDPGAGVPDIRAPKHGSERAVYLPDQLVQLLSAYVATLKSDWLFTRRDGRPWDQNKINQWWPKVHRAAGVVGVRLHDLRHFYASALIAESCDVVTVQKALGHSSATVTLGTYAHLWPKAEDRTRRAAGALFTAVATAADSVRTEAGS
jgi:integrase